MTRGATRRKRASGQRGIPRAARGGGRGAPRERRDASDEKARSRTGRDPPPKMEVRFILRNRRMATGSVRGLRGVRGERTSEGFLPPFFLFLGAISSGRWTCAGAATGARVWRPTEAEKYSSRYAAFFRARAQQSLRCESFDGTLNRHYYRGLSHVRSVFIIGKCRNRMKSSLVFYACCVFPKKQQRHPLRQSLSPRDVLRRVETVGSGFRLRGEAPAEGRAAPRVAAAGAAWRVRRPRARRRAAGVQVRAAARAIGRGDARRAVRGGREGRRAGRPAEGPAEQEQVEGRGDGGRAKPPVVVLPGTSSDRGSYTIGEFDTHR